METLGFLIQGFEVALTPTNLLLAFLGCFLGTIIGALPGLGPSNGVAILIPLAFTLGLDADRRPDPFDLGLLWCDVWRPHLFDIVEHSRRRTGA